MGWKQYLSITFPDCDSSWGDLQPIRIIFPDREVCTRGVLTDSSNVYRESPKNVMYGASKVRIRVKYYVIFEAGQYGNVAIYISTWENDTRKKFNGQYELVGILHSLDSPRSYNVIEEREAVFEFEGATMRIYVDGQELASYTIDAPLTHFSLCAATKELYGSTGRAGVAIEQVVGEYYDQFEDMIAQFMSIFNVMIPMMFIIMMLPMVISLFRGIFAEPGGGRRGQA
ncbi:hypothetical protein [Alphaspiravirus yamagawaense]|uniref:Uncharacterized protein n=1 Tax=Alphaspiravirus yamagawaense TaxID=1157339 RepID=J7QC63_9VIRU|nr:hypothetical protein [Aeropyrum coil-shaped virus]CCG27834.1 hypothetical protein [Aeropyrum coil-shaped virus]